MLNSGATTGDAVAVAVALGVVGVGLGRGVLVRKSRVAGNDVCICDGAVGNAAVGNAVGNAGAGRHAPTRSNKPNNKYLLIVFPISNPLPFLKRFPLRRCPYYTDGLTSRVDTDGKA